jgi:hypothetical protein
MLLGVAVSTKYAGRAPTVFVDNGVHVTGGVSEVAY